MIALTSGPCGYGSEVSSVSELLMLSILTHTVGESFFLESLERKSLSRARMLLHDCSKCRPVLRSSCHGEQVQELFLHGELRVDEAKSLIEGMQSATV